MAEKGQTIVKWGSRSETLEIYNVHSVRFNQEAVFDSANINLIGTKFTYSAVGYVHDYLDFDQPHVDPVPSGSDAVEAQRNIRFLAMKQRQRLEIIVGADTDGSGGTTLLEVDPFRVASTNVAYKDLDNGPRCTQMDVRQINATFMRVEFTFEATISECDSAGGSPNTSGVLSNTWSCEDSLDQNLMIKNRQWTGQLRVANAYLNPHSFRDWVLPPLQDGMYRDSMTFASSEDGLTLNYSIIDREGYFSPPPPATEWTSPLRAVYTTGTGKMTFVEASVGLAGDRDADKRLLLSLATQLVESKILALDGNLEDEKGNKLVSVIESFAVSEEISAKSSNVYVSAIASRPAIGEKYNQILDSSFGKDPKEQIQEALRRGGLNQQFDAWDTNKFRGNWKTGAAGPERNRGRTPESEGSIPSLMALSVYLQTPCSGNHGIRSGVSAGLESDARSASKKPPKIKMYKSGEVKPVEPLTSYTNKNHRSNMYTVWEMQSRYESSQHTVQMPIARFSAASPSSSQLPSSAFIALAPPQTVRKIRFKGKRIGAVPETPVPKSFQDPETGIAFHLLRYEDLPATPDYRPGGEKEFFRQGEIVYGLSREPKAGESLPIGMNPYDLLGLVRADLPRKSGFDEGPAIV